MEIKEMEKLASLVRYTRKIKSRQTHREISQREFAEMIGISRSYLGDIETARIAPSFEIVLKIVKVCDLPLEYFNINHDWMDFFIIKNPEP